MTESSNPENKPEANSGDTKDVKAQVVKTESKGPETKANSNLAKGRSKPVGHEQATRKAQRKVTKPGKSDSTKVSARRVSPFLWGLVLTNTLLLVFMGLAGGYFWYASVQHDQQQALDVQQSIQSAAQSIEAQSKAQQAAVKQQLQSENSLRFDSVNAEHSRLSQQVNELTSTLDKLNGNQTDRQLDAEVAYLIRMAERKVVIEQNVLHARYLLMEAAHLLSDNSEPRRFRLRELLEQDLNQLQIKKLSNNDALLIKLNALLSSTTQLKFAKPQQVFGQPQQKPSDDISEWRQNLGIMWDRLTDDFLSWEVIDEPFQPYLNMQQQAIVRGMLQYHILTAQHAVLSREPQLYQSALQLVDTLLPKFDQDAEQLIMVKQQLAVLTSQTITEEVVISLRSYAYLRAQGEGSESETIAPVINQTTSEPAVPAESGL